MKNIKLIALILVFIAQSAYVIHTIAKAESTLDNGELYKIQTAPMDPYDPFRGRYVTLRFAMERAPILLESGVLCEEVSLDGQNVWAILEKNEQDIAHVQYVSRHYPEKGDAIAVSATHCTDDNKIHIKLPFERFFANELSAPKLERDAREHADNTYLWVRVNGKYAIAEHLEIPKNEE